MIVSKQQSGILMEYLMFDEHSSVHYADGNYHFWSNTPFMYSVHLDKKGSNPLFRVLKDTADKKENQVGQYIHLDLPTHDVTFYTDYDNKDEISLTIDSGGSRFMVTMDEESLIDFAEYVMNVLNSEEE